MTTSMQAQAMALLRECSHGVLSTLSQAMGAYPYGSFVPYVLDADGRPIILISRLAQHSRNIKADPRVSLTVCAVPEAAADLQDTPRLCLLADAEACADEAGQREYLRRFPQARDYLQLDFEFYRLLPLRMHLVAGFGKVQWMDPFPGMSSR